MRGVDLNETLNLFKRHRSIRQFKKERVKEEDMKAIFEAYTHAPSSLGLQEASIIHVTDQDLKNKIMEISSQEYVKDIPELFIFVADIYRNRQIAIERGFEIEKKPSLEMLIQGFTDSIIGAENMAIAAESLGLGVVYLGSVLNDYEKLIDLLDLPKYTFPVVGMGMGYPDQDPQVKPKMSIKYRCFENKYKTSDNYLEELSGYDKEMNNYYDTRANGKRSDDFTNIAGKLHYVLLKNKGQVLNILRKQGFDVD